VKSGAMSWMRHGWSKCAAAGRRTPFRSLLTISFLLAFDFQAMPPTSFAHTGTTKQRIPL
jgi:hypothetical protein